MTQQFTGPPSISGTTARRPSLGIRGVCAGLALVIAAVLLPLATVGFWGQRTVTDTERFIETVGPLADDERIRADIARAVTDALMRNVNTDQLVRDWLPPAASPLAAPLSSTVEAFVFRVTEKLLASQQFRNIWLGTAATLQKAIIAALSGQSDGPVHLQDDDIVLDLSEVFAAVRKQLEDNGLGVLARTNLPPQADRQIVLLNAEQVATARFAYSLTVPIARWLIVIVLLLFVAAVLLAHRRARMLAWAGGCVVLGALVVQALLWVGESAVVGSASTTPFSMSSDVFYATLTAYLSQAVVWLLLIGAAALMIGWLLSGQVHAQRIRAAVSNR